MTKHFKSDGNGGFNVSSTLMIIAILVTLILSIVPGVVAYGMLKQSVDDNSKDIEDFSGVITDVAVIKNDVNHIKETLDTLIKSS